MKAAILLGLCLTAVSSLSFKDFVLHFNKSYSSIEEVARRQQNFLTSLKEISEINNRNATWRAGINKFSDMSWDEFRAFYLINTPQDCSATYGTHKLSGGRTMCLQRVR